MGIGIITNLIFLISSLYIAIVTVKTYIQAKENHIAALYWGSSFSLLFIMFLIYTIAELYNYYSCNLAFFLHIVKMFIFMLMFKVALQLFFSTRKNVLEQVFFWKRMVKFIYSVIFPLILAWIVIQYNTPIYTNNDTGLLGLQIIGIYKIDIYFELLHILLLIGVFLLLPWRYYFLHLRMGFFILIISEIIQLINIIYFNYNNIALQNIEWSLTVVSIILFVMGIRMLYKPEALPYRKLNENLKEYYDDDE